MVKPVDASLPGIVAVFALLLVNCIIVTGVAGFTSSTSTSTPISTTCTTMMTTTKHKHKHPSLFSNISRRGTTMMRRFSSSTKDGDIDSTTENTNTNNNKNTHNNDNSGNNNKKEEEKEEEKGTEIVVDENKKIERLTNNPLRLAVLRFGMTELRGTSRYNYSKKTGTYDCGYCGATLFESSAQYDSKSGWPSFFRSANDNSLSYKREFDGRIECKCQTCDSHLGHVFMDGPYEDTVEDGVLNGRPRSDPIGTQRTKGRLPRFCVNGACLDLKEKK